MNKTKIVFQIFLILVFLAGIYVVATYNIKNHFESFDNKQSNPVDCPDLLVQKGNELLLYNTKKQIIAGINPVTFKSLDDYKVYLETQHKEGIHCPVLFLQREYDIQGNPVYRAQENPIQMEGGISRFNNMKKNDDAINAMLSDTRIPLYNPTNYEDKPLAPQKPLPLFKEDEHGMPIPVIDASRENGNYNANNYAGFDPYGLFVGKYTTLDEVHNSTRKSQQSDNPMDTNWGGISHTQNSIDSGKYEENNITKPQLFQPKGTYNPDLPSVFPRPNDKI